MIREMGQCTSRKNCTDSPNLPKNVCVAELASIPATTGRDKKFPEAWVSKSKQSDRLYDLCAHAHYFYRNIKL